MSHTGSSLDSPFRQVGLLWEGCDREGVTLSHSSTEIIAIIDPTLLQEVLDKYCGLQVNEWKLLLKIRVMPKTPQHLQSQDPISFQYFYDQVRQNSTVEPLNNGNHWPSAIVCYSEVPLYRIALNYKFIVIERLGSQYTSPSALSGMSSNVKTVVCSQVV